MTIFRTFYHADVVLDSPVKVRKLNRNIWVLRPEKENGLVARKCEIVIFCRKKRV
jgi:hypothetical protein